MKKIDYLKQHRIKIVRFVIIFLLSGSLTLFVVLKSGLFQDDIDKVERSRNTIYAGLTELAINTSELTRLDTTNQLELANSTYILPNIKSAQEKITNNIDTAKLPEKMKTDLISFDQNYRESIATLETRFNNIGKVLQYDPASDIGSTSKSEDLIQFADRAKSTSSALKSVSDKISSSIAPASSTENVLLRLRESESCFKDLAFLLESSDRSASLEKRINCIDGYRETKMAAYAYAIEPIERKYTPDIIQSQMTDQANEVIKLD